MRDYLKFYINGEWVDPVTPRTLDVQNPANEEAYARISIGSKADVDKAVAAAKAAFPAFAATSKEYRADLLDKIVAVYSKRLGDMAAAVSEEMGAPMWLAQAAQAPSGLGHLMQAANYLRTFEFEDRRGKHLIRSRSASAASSRHGTGRRTRSPARSRPRSLPAAPWC